MSSNDELVRSPGEARTSHVVGYLACASLKDLCGAGRAAPNEWNDLKKRPLIYSIEGGIAFREFRVEVTLPKLAVEELLLYLISPTRTISWTRQREARLRTPFRRETQETAVLEFRQSWEYHTPHPD